MLLIGIHKILAEGGWGLADTIQLGKIPNLIAKLPKIYFNENCNTHFISDRLSKIADLIGNAIKFIFQ